MAFIKREESLNFGLDDEIYNTYVNRNVKTRHSGDFQLGGLEQVPLDSLQDLQTGTMGPTCARSPDISFVGAPGYPNFPFPIKAELDDGTWMGQQNRGHMINSDEDQSGSQMNRNNVTTSQNMSLDLATAYNNSIFYQNFQGNAPFQQVLPLDFYGRHHQALANSILSAYSNTNGGSMTSQPYFKPNQEQIINAPSSKETNGNQMNLKRKDLQSDLLKNINTIYSQAMNNRIHNNIDAMVNQSVLSDAIEMSRKMNNQNNDVKEVSAINNFYNNLKTDMSNGLSKLPQYDKAQLPSNLLNDRMLLDKYKNEIDDFNKMDSDNSTVRLPSIKTVKKECILKCHRCYIEFSCEQELKEHSDVCEAYSVQMDLLQPKKTSEIDDTFTFTNDLEAKGRYTCENCSYSCQSPAILKIHERTHSGEKPFSCSFCDYKSGQKNNVAKHILVHMKEKPFRCQYCDYKCAQKNNLVVHERTHTGEKPFACTFCDYKTVQKPNLVKHMYLHTNEKPYGCDICDYRCVQKTNLLKHKQKHSMEKPFECSDCDYKSSQKSNLNKHLYMHTKDKPFQCEFCPYRCVQKCNLAKHRQSKHNIMGNDNINIGESSLNLSDNASCVYSDDLSLKISPQNTMDCVKEEGAAFSVQTM